MQVRSLLKKNEICVALGAERVCARSGSVRSADKRARSEIQTARAWPRAAQHLFFLCGRVGEGYILFIKNLQITTWFLAIYSDKLCEKEVALHILLFFLFYTFLCSTSSC